MGRGVIRDGSRYNLRGSPPDDIPIADRTGGGDSFASGVLAALFNGNDLQTAVQWGAAHGILVQETPGDITMIEENAVLAEVKRAPAAGV